MQPNSRTLLPVQRSRAVVQLAGLAERTAAAASGLGASWVAERGLVKVANILLLLANLAAACSGERTGEQVVFYRCCCGLPRTALVQVVRGKVKRFALYTHAKRPLECNICKPGSLVASAFCALWRMSCAIDI